MMHRREVAVFVTWVLCVSAHLRAQTSKSMTFQSNQTLVNAVAFLTDDTVVVAGCALVTSKECGLQIWAIEEKSFRLIVSESRIAGVDSLHRSHAGILVSFFPFGRQGRLVSLDLKTSLPITFDDSRISISGDTIGWYPGPPLWKIWRIYPGDKELREGPLILNSVSDDGFVVLNEKEKHLYAETFDGKHSLRMKGFSALVLDSQRVFVDKKIVNFGGRTLVKLQVPAGWGSTRWNADASRVIFDFYSHKLTAGDILMPLNDNAPTDTRVIRALDTRTGAICFESKQRSSEYTVEPMQSRSDISPSGRRAAIITGGALTIEELPETCGVRR